MRAVATSTHKLTGYLEASVASTAPGTYRRRHVPGFLFIRLVTFRVLAAMHQYRRGLVEQHAAMRASMRAAIPFRPLLPFGRLQMNHRLSSAWLVIVHPYIFIASTP